MMTEKEINALDVHVEKHLDKTQELADAKMLNICSVWQGVKPIIKVARALLFWKPKWQAVIDQLITALDEACPGTGL